MSILDKIEQYIESQERSKTVHYLNNKSKKKTFHPFNIGDTVVYQNDDEGTPLHKRAHEVCRLGKDGMKYCFNPRKEKILCDDGTCKVVEK